jgi:hypothetical protein
MDRFGTPNNFERYTLQPHNKKNKEEPIQWPTKDGGTKLCWYDLDYLNLQNFLKSSELEIRDRVQQIATFDKILDRLVEQNGGPITREQFENEDHVYWERRLANQAMDEMISRNTGIGVGTYVYSAEIANSVSRGLDGSIINNEITFFRSNNTVASVDVANSVIVLANNFVGTAIANGAIVYFGNVMLQTALTQANTYGRDTILVTDSRLANANTTLANVGSVSTGWVHVYKKTNADGTIRFLKETLVCLSNAAASNAQSANTATGGQIFSGV